MAISNLSQGGHAQYNLREFVLDDENDLENLPIDRVPMGSAAFVISTSKVYMLNSSGEWKEI